MNPIHFDGIKENLKEYIRNTTDFKDVNYEGSGINQLINILAYAGTYFGYYIQANDNEHYLQTAQTRSSLTAQAKRNGYIVRGRKCSHAEVKVETVVDSFPDNGYVHVSRELNVVGINSLSDKHRNFLFNKDVYLYDYERLPNNKFRFYSDDNFTLYQGERREWRFNFTGNKEQRFIIKDDTIDIDTLRVFVKNTDNYNELGEEYILSQNAVNDYGKDNKIFHISTAEEGWYEIFFGNNIIGKSPNIGQFIYCEYMSPDGSDGDGCTQFKLGNFDLTTTSPSFGGSNGESNEAIRHNAQYYFRRQNRLFTTGDIKSILLEEYRNIKCINVWGGEDNIPKKYGKTLIAIKPNNSESLSAGAKIDIRKRLLDKYGYCGMDIEMVDPEYVNVDVEFTAILSDRVSDITKRNVEEDIKKLVKEYDRNYLNQFGYYLNDLDLNSYIKDNIESIESIYSKKFLTKVINVNTNNTSSYSTSVSNKIIPLSIKSRFSDYNYTWDMKDDGKGNLIATTKSIYGENIKKTIGTVDYDNGLYTFNLPLSSAKDFSYDISITAEAFKPNIYSRQLNIVRIGVIEVKDVLQTQE